MAFSAAVIPDELPHLSDCSGSSFGRTPESSNIECLLDAGVRRHEGKLCFPSFCDVIIPHGLAKSQPDG
jgi:hypothetical protein